MAPLIEINLIIVHGVHIEPPLNKYDILPDGWLPLLLTRHTTATLALLPLLLNPYYLHHLIFRGLRINKFLYYLRQFYQIEIALSGVLQLIIKHLAEVADIVRWNMLQSQGISQLRCLYGVVLLKVSLQVIVVRSCRSILEVLVQTLLQFGF